MESSDDVYVTVCSNNNLDLFENTTSHFTNRLFQPLQFSSQKGYECALINMTVDLNEISINLNTPLINFDISKPITVNKPILIYYDIPKGTWYVGEASSQRFFNELVSASRLLKYVEFSQNYGTEQNFKVDLDINLPEGYSFVLDSKLSHLLGLDQRFDSNGHYSGTSYLSDEALLNSVDDLNEIQLGILKFETIQVHIPKPVDDSLDSFAESINSALENNGIEANIVFDDEQAVVNIQENYLELQFPDYFNLALGLSINHRFKYPSEIIYLYQLLSRASREHILVICNFLKDQPYCSSLIPVLKVLPRSSFSKNVVAIGNLEYIPVVQNYIADIDVLFLNQNLDPVFLGKNPITVTLHFRERK